MVLRSPNELFEAAKKIMDIPEPTTWEDWVAIMNFMANSIHSTCALPACKFLAKLYDMPLKESEVEEIVDFQLKMREHQQKVKEAAK